MASKTQSKVRGQAHARLRSAVDAISADSNLRYLFREILSRAGLDDAPASDNALVTARLCGRQALGFEIQGLLLSFDPMLYATMVREAAQERLAEDAGESYDTQPNEDSDVQAADEYN